MAREPTTTTAGKWLLAAVIVLSGELLGLLHTETLAAMSALAAVACGLLWASPGAPLTRGSRWVLVAFGLLFAASVLQAVPLPAGIVRTLSPASADIWDRALAPFHEAAPAWRPLSIAPVATHVEVLRGAFYGCVLLGALRVCQLERGDTFLVRVVLAASLAMAFAALAHGAVSAERVFGIYKPREGYAYRTGRLAPLLNLNHLVAYLNVGAFVAVGALSSRRVMPRVLSASVALVLILTSMWQGSRGGVGALVVGVVLTLALALYTRRRRLDSKWIGAALLAGCVAAAALVVAWSTSEVTQARLASRETIKVDIARRTFGLATSSPLTGFGRGGFESVFPSVAGKGGSYYTFTHPENLVAEWCVEWGFPVAVVALGILVWALRPQVVLRAARPPVGPWVAVVVAAVHDLVDFHFDVPGVTVLVLPCIAIVVTREPPHARAEGAPSRDVPGRALAVAAALGVLLGIAWSLPERSRSLAEERRAMSALAVDRRTSPEAFRSELRASMLRYPAEAFLPLMGAVRQQTVDGGSVVPWIGRALERHPHFGRAHFVLARSLASARRDAQARLEYRLAYEADVDLRGAIANEAFYLVTDFASAMELVPDDPALHDEVLEKISAAIRPRLPSTSWELDAELARTSATALGPLRRRVEATLSDVRNGHAWCDKDCLGEGIAAARTWAERDPSSCEPLVRRAELRIEAGDGERAIDDMERSMDALVVRGTCQRELVRLAFAAGGKRGRGEALLDKLLRGSCGTAEECVELYAWAAGTESARGRNARAGELYRRAVEVEPGRDDLLLRQAESFEAAGMAGFAIEAYTKLAGRHPDDPRWSTRIVELRKKSHEIRLQP